MGIEDVLFKCVEVAQAGRTGERRVQDHLVKAGSDRLPIRILEKEKILALQDINQVAGIGPGSRSGGDQLEKRLGQILERQASRLV
jgi:hypothetical protein